MWKGITESHEDKYNKLVFQGTKKFRSNSPGLVNFAAGLVDLIFHLPDGQVNILGSHT